MQYRVKFYKPTYPKRLESIDRDSFYNIVESANEKLGDRFEYLLDTPNTLTINNPSSAIHISLCAMDLKRGDKIICPINVYADVPEAIRHFDS